MKVLYILLITQKFYIMRATKAQHHDCDAHLSTSQAYVPLIHKFAP